MTLIELLGRRFIHYWQDMKIDLQMDVAGAGTINVIVQLLQQWFERQLEMSRRCAINHKTT